MEFKEKNNTANRLVVIEFGPDELEPAKQNLNVETKTPFKIRKPTTLGFERAEWEQAENKAKQMSVQHYKNETVSLWTDLPHFRIYGPGIYLFFNFTKKIAILFIILMILALIPTVYNAIGGIGYQSTKTSLPKYLGILSIGNLKPSGPSLADKLINAIPILFSSLTFFIFFVYWNKKSNEQVRFVKSNVKLISYKAVEIIKFPKNITQSEITAYMSQFGQVKQISTVRNFNDTIYYCRQIYEKTLNGKEIVLQRQKKKIQPDQKFNAKIQQKQLQLQKLYQKLSQQQQSSSKQIIKFFVTFQSPQERQKAVETFKPFIQSRMPCFKKRYPEQLRLNGEQVLVRACHTEPAGIIWENVHVTWKTRWIRLLLQLLLIGTVIFLGFCLILSLNVLNPPITTSNIDSSMHNSETILEVSDLSIIRSWCLNNNDLVVESGESNFGKLCEKNLSSNISRILISVAIAFGIMTIKYVIKQTIIRLSKFMRYKTHTEEVVEMTKNLFFTYFFSTVLITIFMQARLNGFKPKDLVKFISSNPTILMNLREINDFDDFSRGWYLDVGYQIWITWLILTITYPILIATYHYPLQKLYHYLAKKQVLQRKMENYLNPREFQIYDHYANLALFIFVGFVFSPGMPSLAILTGIGLLLRYPYLKFIFVRFSRIPKPIDESLNNVMKRFLLFGLFTHLILAIWMYGVGELFNLKDSLLNQDLYSPEDSNFKKFWTILLKRLVDSWYLTGLLVFYLFYFFLWRLLRDIQQKLTGHNSKIYKAAPEMLRDTLGKNGGYAIGIASQRSLTNSYKIEQNPDYFDLLAITQRRQYSSSINQQK